MKAELEWSHRIGEIPEAGLETARRASPAARARIAAALDLLACNRLEAHYKVQPLSDGRYLLEGSIEADVVQTCVVTLEPVESHIAEPLEVEFRSWPGGSGVTEFDALEARDIEPLEDGIIPIGRIVYEQLASAIDPYPRKEGVAFDESRNEPSPAAEAIENDANPFAVLKRLRDK